MEKKNLFFLLEKRRPIRPEKNNYIFLRENFLRKIFVENFFLVEKNILRSIFFLEKNQKNFLVENYFFFVEKKRRKK